MHKLLWSVVLVWSCFPHPELSLTCFHPPSVTFLFYLTVFSGIRYPLLTANSVCSNELWDLMLYTTHMTMQQNGREGDEKIIAIHSILPGDVISVTVKGGGEERDDKETSVSMRDKH